MAAGSVIVIPRIGTVWIHTKQYTVVEVIDCDYVNHVLWIRRLDNGRLWWITIRGFSKKYEQHYWPEGYEKFSKVGYFSSREWVAAYERKRKYC